MGKAFEAAAQRLPMATGPVVVDVLPNVPYFEGSFEPGAIVTPERVTLAPSTSGPSLEALAAKREQLRANLYHARQSMKDGTDDGRCIAAERALHAFDASGDGCRLHIVARRALRESPWAEKTFAKEIHDLLNVGSVETAMLKLKEYLK